MVSYQDNPNALGTRLNDGATGFRYLEWAAAGLVAFFLVVGLHRLFITNINWDEFYFLSFVYLHRNGDLALHLQTFHVHFFSWLPSVAKSEITQIFAARGVVWLVSLASTWLIYRIATHFCSRLGALLAAVFYLSFTSVMDHGTSFRADPFCALFILVAVHLLVNKADRTPAIALAALSLAVAMMISIKSALYAPTIAVLLVAPLLARSHQWGALRTVAIFGFCFIGSLAGLYFLHSLSLAPTPSASAGSYVTSAGSKTLGAGILVPAWPFVVRAIAGNPLTWTLIFYGLWVTGRRLFTVGRRIEAAMALALALPLLSLLVYRNAFPYFFVFLMPTAVILASIAVDHLAALATVPRGRVIFAALAGTLALTTVTFATNYARKLPDQTVVQAETVRLVHAMFPEPVPYIDRNSMISSFPKVGFFMSSWGLESYRAAKRPIMAGLIAQYAPPLLIANSPALDLSIAMPSDQKDNPYSLFQEDFEFLRENYVHHWGAVYVAGKRLELPAGAEPQTFEILITGTYTLETDGSVDIDGESMAPGSHVTLTRGSHTVTAADSAARRVILRWGRDLFVPADRPSAQPLYIGL